MRPGSADATPRARLAYVLPVRVSLADDPDLLTGYLSWLAARLPLVLVVDGSDPQTFARNHARWPSAVRHVRPDAPATVNGKVGGVCTGIRLAAAAGCEACIVADDDVRYDAAALAAMAEALRSADVVRPQNYFSPRPWHALEDTARSLLNRVLGGDWPGTLGVRCAALADGYAGDVLFENLELVRTVRAFGGHELIARGLYVRRLPPEVGHFLGQRVRQAYDSFAQPARLVAELLIIPMCVAAAIRRPGALAGAALAAVAVAEVGRCRDGGRAYFPAAASWCAPLWLAERGICSWLAVGARLRGGVRYRGGRIRRAAHSQRQLRRGAFPAPAGLMRSVAERRER